MEHKLPYSLHRVSVGQIYIHSETADGVVCSHVPSRIFVKNSGNINKYVCNKCSVYETQLKEALDELGSARLIIDILQKELLIALSTKNAHGNDLASTEGFVDIKLRRRKIKSSKWENKNVLKSQQSQPIPVIVNRYAPLDSIQEEPEMSQNHNRTSEIALLREKKKCPPNAKKKNS
jgi:hypothetical protein